MILLPEANLILNAFACFAFTGLITVFILPEVIFTYGYLLPKAIRHVSARQVQSHILWTLTRKPLIVMICACLLFGAIFLLSPKTGYYLTSSIPAIICWVLLIPATLWLFTAQRKERLSDFYLTLYTKYLTLEEREKYRQFIEAVSDYSISQTQFALLQSDLSFLEKKALRERILLLKGAEKERVTY